jgi:hypothetical protein
MDDSIEKISLELLERLATEEGRPATTPGTHLVGGLVKAGVKLEALLRAIVLEVADVDGVDPGALLAPSGARPTSIHKAMAGPLAHGLRSHLETRRPQPPIPAQLRPILDDLVRRDSRIFAFITMRNEIAKEGQEPKLAVTVMKKLRELVSGFRKHAGWS